MSMATLINGGYYVNMGKLMTNYLLKVYCTMKYASLWVCAVVPLLFHLCAESLLNHEATANVSNLISLSNAMFKLGS